MKNKRSADLSALLLIKSFNQQLIYFCRTYFTWRVPRLPQGSHNGYRQNAGNHDQRNANRDVINIHDHHFDTHEGQHSGKPIFQVLEFAHDVCQQEVECAQAKDGKDVRGVNNEQILSHRKNGRDEVDSEDQVCALNDEQDQKEGCCE